MMLGLPMIILRHRVTKERLAVRPFHMSMQSACAFDLVLLIYLFFSGVFIWGMFFILFCLLLHWPMIKKWHYGRKGVALKPSRACKHSPCTLDLVCGQSLCLPCDPIYEALFSSYNFYLFGLELLPLLRVCLYMRLCNENMHYFG